MHGGLAQGIGQALWEEAVFDEKRPAALLDPDGLRLAEGRRPAVASSTTTPARDSPRTTLGVKGIGEAATIGSTPAIANAVVDALRPHGIEHVELPLTPQKVWAALAAAPKK